MKVNFYKPVLLIIILFFGALTAEAQIVKAYGAAGFNLSQVDGDQAFGYKKFGVNVGVGANVGILPFMSVSVEANFNQKGANQKAYIVDTIRHGAYKININYAEIPVIFYFADKTRNYRLGVGVSYARMVNEAREDCYRTNDFNHIIYNKNDKTISFNDFPGEGIAKDKAFSNYTKEWNEMYGKLNPNDFNIIGCLEARVWQNLKLEFRIAYSLRKLRTSDFYRQYETVLPKKVYAYRDGEYLAFQRKEYNNTMSFRVIYVINENQADRSKALIKSRKDAK